MEVEMFRFLAGLLGKKQQLLTGDATNVLCSKLYGASLACWLGDASIIPTAGLSY